MSAHRFDRFQPITSFHSQHHSTDSPFVSPQDQQSPPAHSSLHTRFLRFATPRTGAYSNLPRNLIARNQSIKISGPVIGIDLGTTNSYLRMEPCPHMTTTDIF